MYPRTHIILGFLFTIILAVFTSLPLLALIIIFASSFLIDVDHWFIYVKEKKDLSVRRAYQWFIKNEKKHKKQKKLFLCVFHTIESFIILFILSFFSQIIFYITIGFSFHYLVDLIHSYFYKGESRKPVSIIAYFIGN